MFAISMSCPILCYLLESICFLRMQIAYAPALTLHQHQQHHNSRNSMTNFFQILKVAAVMAAMVDGQYFASVEEAFNPGEERGSFDLIMDPYAIPAETTTYVDFVFNLPDDLPDLFHVTYGEIINSQPDHLHHFALLGCPDKVWHPSENNTSHIGTPPKNALFWMSVTRTTRAI